MRELRSSCPHRAAALIAAVTLVSSCSSDSNGTVDPINDVASIEVVGPPTSLIPNEQYTVTASPRNASGAELSSIPVIWKSSNESVATVVNGVVSAVSPGTADIIAEAEGKQGRIPLLVVTTERLVSEDRYTGGGVIGFSSSRNGGELNVYLMDASGTRKITTSPDHEQFDGFSPDGQRLALLRFPVNTDQVSSHIVNADGTNDVLVSQGIINWAPDWLHRGTVVDGQLSTSNADGSGVHAVGPTGSAAGPWWSVDGKRIAFAYAPILAANADIFVANADGSGLLNVTNTPTVSEEYASWSPDGTKLAITGLNRGVGLGSSVYVVNVSGTGLTQLTNEPATRDDYEPQWSPDGKFISYTTYFGNTYGLFLMRATGGKPVRMAPPTMVAGFGHWSPDGTRLAFTAIGEGSSRQNIFVVTLDRRTITQLTRNTADNLGPFWRP
ncbi:MAG TPA: hypothetical protein VF042_04860 [Gemmatimonadaceae bacterium]